MVDMLERMGEWAVRQTYVWINNQSLTLHFYVFVSLL
jgi:hypothetical protein